MTVRRSLAVLAVAGGLLAAVSGSPYRAKNAVLDVDRIAAAVAAEEDHVTAVELAQWIRDREPGLRILDLRTKDEFDDYHVPRSERVPIDALSATPFRATDTIVLISDGGAHAAQGWVLLQALGQRNVYFLRGGIREWLDDVMSPARSSELTEYFGGVPRVTTPQTDTAAAVLAMRRRGC
jgi:rhodanese-related sulfurtransferase